MTMADEKRLVYAEDVLELLEDDRVYMTDVGYIHAKAAVNEAPTVDPSELVYGKWSDSDENCNEC